MGIECEVVGLNFGKLFQLPNGHHTLENNSPIPAKLSSKREFTAVLSWFTIAGSLLTVLLLSMLGSAENAIDEHNGRDTDYYFYYVLVFSCLGTALGAVLMLRRLSLGLWVYLVAQLVFGYVISMGIHLQPDGPGQRIANIVFGLVLLVTVCFSILHFYNAFKAQKDKTA